MATRTEIEDAIDELNEAAYACGEDVSTGFPYPRQSFVDRRRDARARLLALLAPEPEPSEAEIMAAGKAIFALLPLRPLREDVGRAALAAARAARQTGGVDIRLNEEQSREFLATAEDEPPGWLKRAAARQARAGQRAEGSE